MEVVGTPPAQKKPAFPELIGKTGLRSRLKILGPRLSAIFFRGALSGFLTLSAVIVPRNPFASDEKI